MLSRAKHLALLNNVSARPSVTSATANRRANRGIRVARRDVSLRSTDRMDSLRSGIRVNRSHLRLLRPVCAPVLARSSFSPHNPPMILITGGMGFIGLHTARSLVDMGEQVVLT